MSTKDITAPVGVEHPHVDTITSLFAIADWLAANPDTPPMSVFVHGRAEQFLSDKPRNPRETMERFAESLDFRVEERTSYSDVLITAHVGPRARVQMSTSIGSLGGQQRKPQFDYEPITEACPACNGEPLPTPAFWHHSYPPVCPTCKGSKTRVRQPAAPERNAA